MTPLSTVEPDSNARPRRTAGTGPRSGAARQCGAGEEPATKPDPGGTERRVARGPGRAYVVQPGDTLAKIAPARDVAGGWRELYESDKRAVGAETGLILPGQRLGL